VTWVLDTNTCIHLMKRQEPLTRRVLDLGPGLFAVSTITCGELWYGAVKSRHPQRSRAEQDAFLHPFRVLDFDAAAADGYASIRHRLASAGKPIGDRDLMIAATALANRMGVLTSNTREFDRVPGLRVEDWTSA
jgi:tRNA(fMet)-specific endonuclease VapC